MPTLRTLGPAGGAIDLTNTAAYRIPVASEQEDPIYEVEMEGVRGGDEWIVGRDDHVGTRLSFDVWCAGGSWSAVRSNYNALYTMARSAYTAYITGTAPVLYAEQNGDEGSPVRYKVARAQVAEVRAHRSVARLRMVARVELTLEPVPTP